jgi:hypothetical protein
MSKIDLHVHSKYSEEVSEQFLRKIGAAESFTEPEYIYRTAKERGMDFVTVTDHNRIDGALLLKEKHPRDVITGMEATAYFPEDGCKIHVLVYGLDEKEYAEIQRLRLNIYDLRDYLKMKNLAHSIAHATYSGSDKLNLEKLEKLILLFDVFEGINGGRSRMDNRLWMQVLRNLTPSHIEDLYRKYRIEPFSATPWVKGFTGGSDDHAGLFIANTFTESAAQTPAELLENLKNKGTAANGKHNDFQSFTFTILKLAYDIAKGKNGKRSITLINQVTEMVFEKKSLRFRDKLKVRLLRYLNRHKKDTTLRHLLELIEKFNSDRSLPVSRKLDLVYGTMGSISDDYLKQLSTSVTRHLEKGNIARLLKDVSASVTGLLLMAPFFGTLRHLCRGRSIIKDLAERFADILPAEKKKTLWFTDTVDQNNPAGASLSPIAEAAHANENLRIAVPLMPDEAKSVKLPYCVMQLPAAFTLVSDTAGIGALKVPSLLASLKMIYEYDPDEIYVSTFGTAGLLGILAARLLNVPCTAVFNEEYYAQIKGQIEAESINTLFDGYTKWFYSACDTITVPSAGQIALLEKKGLDPQRITVADMKALSLTLMNGITEFRNYVDEQEDNNDDYIGGNACA